MSGGLPTQHTTVPRGCESALDAYCAQYCPHAAVEKLYARFDGSAASAHAKVWRCYAGSTLDAAKQRYVKGDMYCTRHPQILEILSGGCAEAEEKSETFDSETAYGPSSDGEDAAKKHVDEALAKLTAKSGVRQPPAERAASQSSSSSSSSSSTTTSFGSASNAAPMPLELTPFVSQDGACADAHAECLIWASYGECGENEGYMAESCMASCGLCKSGFEHLTKLPPPTPPKYPCFRMAARRHCRREPTPTPPRRAGLAAAGSPIKSTPLREMDMGSSTAPRAFIGVTQRRDVWSSTVAFTTVRPTRQRLRRPCGGA